MSILADWIANEPDLRRNIWALYLKDQIIPVAPASYIVYKEHNRTFVKNGLTGAIEYSSDDDAAAIQYALDSAGRNGGGKVLLRHGTYYLSRPLCLQQYPNELGCGNVIHHFVVLEGEDMSTTLTSNKLINSLITGRALYAQIRNLRLNGNNRLVSYGYYLDASSLTAGSSRMIFENIEIISTANYAFYSKQLLAFYLIHVITDDPMYVWVSGDFVELRNCRTSNVLSLMASQGRIVGGVYGGIYVTGNGVISIEDVWISESYVQYFVRVDGNLANLRIKGLKGMLPSGKNGIILNYAPEEILIESSDIFLSGNNILIQQIGGSLTGSVVLRNVSISTQPGAPTSYLAYITTTIYRRDKIVLDNVGITHYGNFAYEYPGNKGTIYALNVTEYDNSTSPATIRNYSDEYLSSSKLKNRGSATIPAGSTSVTVSHGLVSTPSRILITPTANVKCWVSNITDRSFMINIDTAQTSNITVYWYAEV